MGAQSYTHRDLAKALGVSETTIKSYRSKFPTFLPVAREGKPVRLHPESLDVCRRIRDLFADGLSILQTSQHLKAEFKEYPHNRRLPISQTQSSGAPSLAKVDAGALASRIEALTKAQDMARERMQQLEFEVRNLATMEAASKSLIAELLGELRAARAIQAPGPQQPAAAHASGTPAAARPAQRSAPQDAVPDASGPAAASFHPHKGSSGPDPQPDPTVVTARKIVTLHGPAGPVASYALGREPKPEPQFPDPQTPPSAFLDLPAVILSDRGDFLGLPGGQSVRRLVEVLSPQGAPAWFQDTPDSWACAMSLGPAQTREMLFERTTTPRGNLVGLIQSMRTNDTEATPLQLQEIFRQLRDQLA